MGGNDPGILKRARTRANARASVASFRRLRMLIRAACTHTTTSREQKLMARQLFSMRTGARTGIAAYKHVFVLYAGASVCWRGVRASISLKLKLPRSHHFALCWCSARASKNILKCTCVPEIILFLASFIMPACSPTLEIFVVKMPHVFKVFQRS